MRAWSALNQPGFGTGLYRLGRPEFSRDFFAGRYFFAFLLAISVWLTPISVWAEEPIPGETRITSQVTFSFNGVTIFLNANVSVDVVDFIPIRQLSFDTEPQLIPGAVDENAPGAPVGLVTAANSDLTFESSDPRFTFDGNNLRLLEGISLNFETEPLIAINVNISDNANGFISLPFDVVVNDQNDGPTAVSINGNLVEENAPGAVVGRLSVEDEDQQDSHIFEVLDVRFEVVDGNQLKLKDDELLGLNAITSVEVTATDQADATVSSTVVVVTNVLDIPPTPSSLRILEVALTGETIVIGPSVCVGQASALSANAIQADFPLSPFAPIGVLTPGPLVVSDADFLGIGDPVIVELIDPDKNLSAGFKDRVIVEVRSDSRADTESVILEETTIDSGRFIGFVASTSKESRAGDCALAVDQNSDIVAVYVDEFDTSDSSFAIVFVSPTSRVFDAETGELLNGIVLTLIDADTGLPVTVFGDGPAYGEFPASVKTGDSFTDAAGARYEFDRGEFRFPNIPDGRYKIVQFVENAFINAPVETFSDSSLQNLPGAPFSLRPGSRGDEFSIGAGPPFAIDMPMISIVRDTPAEEDTTSLIEFLQFTADPNLGDQVNVGLTQCVTQDGPTPVQLMGGNIPIPGVVNLVPSDAFRAGDPIFVRVTDSDQNADPLVREVIGIELRTPILNEKEFLQLLETDPNSGVFVGYLQSSDTPVTESGAQHDCTLSVAKNENITTVYTDAFDRTDVSEISVLVDPFGIFFDSQTGEPVNDVVVTLISVDNDAPAEVFGDGPAFAPYPSTVTSGASTIDEAGIVYDFPQGMYRFPFVAPGLYKLVATPPEGHVFPSSVSTEQLQVLPGAPFVIVVGSRGEVFEVPDGPPVQIDLPLDAINGDIVLTKSASANLVSHGDFIRYSIDVQNLIGFSGLAGVTLRDSLPVGFRYQSGSLRVDGEKVPDPEGADGRTLLIPLNSTALEVKINYVVEVTAASPLGDAVNTASAFGPRVDSSNTASATVRVIEELLRSKAILVGQVTRHGCELAEGSEPEGIKDVRLYLEDGATVLTDSDGQYHIEGINPGTHVIQLDYDSLPERYELAPCNEGNQFAGRNYSQFLDVKGGTVWRADFVLREKNPPETEVRITQELRQSDNRLLAKLNVTHDDIVELEKLDVIYRVPKGFKMFQGSSMVDGENLEPIGSIVGLVWKLSPESDHEITFELVLEQPTSSTPVTRNESVVLRPLFKSRSAILDPGAVSELNDLGNRLRDKKIEEISITGHTDNIKIAMRNRSEFADNYALSEARAQAVANYLTRFIGLQAKRINIVGRGPDSPVAGNKNKKGRAKNRRVELEISYTETEIPAAQNSPFSEYLKSESKVRLSFRSDGTARGSTPGADIKLVDLKPDTAVVESTSGNAKGSWDIIGPTGNADVSNMIVHDADTQGILSFRDGDTLSVQVSAVRLDLDSRLRPRLLLDGVEIPSDRIGFRQEDSETGKTLYSYIGVFFGEIVGPRLLRLEGLDESGDIKFEENLTVIRTGKVAEIKLISVGRNIADGKTPVTARLKLYDERDHEINTLIRLAILDGDLTPYNTEQDIRDFEQLTREVELFPNGEVRFAPVTKGGVYTLRLGRDGVEERIDIYVEPEKRDWILVGMAEGTVAYEKLSGNMTALKANDHDEFVEDGRVAFYAKGLIKGEWLLTLAYDTNKRDDQSLLGTIDPGTFYTLYGDASQQAYDAPSARKLYLRIERNQFYGLFGDFVTGFNVTELSRYSRTLNGAYTEFHGENIQVKAFVSETSQGFVRDDIRGDGTSGLYQLSEGKVIRNSEKVIIETRDRFQNQIVLESESRLRHLEYDIDYDRGTLFFKTPVFSQDEFFNPIFIVIQYEVENDGMDHLTAGARLQYQFNEDRGRVGATVVSEDSFDKSGELAGVDLEYQLSVDTEIRAEFATTRSKAPGEQSRGDSFLVTAIHRGEKILANAFVRGQDASFGIGQLSGAEKGTEKIGGDMTYNLNDQWAVSGRVNRDKDKASGLNRDVVEARAEYKTDYLNYFAGVRSARDSGGGLEERQSNQLVAGTTMTTRDKKLNVNIQTDSSLAGKGENSEFPTRLGVTADYRLNERVSVVGNQEFSWGEDFDTRGTRFGLKYRPWNGAETATTIEQKDGENGQRTFANIGLQQTWRYNDRWSFDVGIDRAQILKDQEVAPSTIGEQAVPAFGGSDFTAVSVGANYKDVDWRAFSRVELRQSDAEDKWNVLAAVQHDLSAGLVIQSAFSAFLTDSESSRDNEFKIDFSMAYRPLESRWTIYNRLEFAFSEKGLGSTIKDRKVVNNFNGNYRWNKDHQIAFQYGFKYILASIDGEDYKGFTDLLGAEYRLNVTDQWDVGLHASILHSWESKVIDYNYGLSVGYLLMQNMWVSLGYNFDGFKDSDFSVAEYSAKGIFFKYRLKVDQDSFRSLFRPEIGREREPQ